MAKIAMITDSHFGVRKNNDIFLESQLRFFKEQFIPYLKDNNIKTVIHLGDFYDNRSSINIKVKSAVFDLLNDDMKDFNMYILVGNHDSYLKNTIEINSLKFLQKFDNITLIEDVEKINIEGRDILLVPWQVSNEDFVRRIANKNINCEIAMGHFETKGFKLNNKMVSDFGIKTDLFFNNYKITFSGHFHTRSLQKRGDSLIQYIGNPYQLTRHDIGDSRGFCIFDTNTLEYEFVNNEVSLKYIVLKYPDRVSKSLIEGNIIDVEVDYDENYNDDGVQKYLQKIETLNPAFPPIPRYTNNFIDGETKEFKTQTVQEIIKEYIDSLNIKNKEEIFKKIEELYDDCKSDLI